MVEVGNFGFGGGGDDDDEEDDVLLGAAVDVDDFASPFSSTSTKTKLELLSNTTQVLIY